jgi:hypothetical protein
MYYAKLKLPSRPLKPNIDIEKISSDRVQNHQFNLDLDILDDSIINSLCFLGFEPSVITAFSFLKPRSLQESLLHSDIIRQGTDWREVNFGINWELTNDDTVFCWWNTTKAPAYPSHPHTFHFNPQGIHYGKRGLRGIDPKTDNLLDFAQLNQGALLIRTNVPHTVHWPSSFRNKPRVAISLRFKNSCDLTWDQAVEKFGRLLV